MPARAAEREKGAGAAVEVLEERLKVGGSIRWIVRRRLRIPARFLVGLRPAGADSVAEIPVLMLSLGVEVDALKEVLAKRGVRI